MDEEAEKVMSDYREEFEISQDERDEEGPSRIAWFLTGAVIGAAVAILYAPKSGKDTRQLLTDRTQRGKEAVTETTQDLTDASRDMFERGRKVVEDAAELFDRARKLVRG